MNQGATPLVQCAFERIEGEVAKFGHGEDVSTSPILFGYLNREVVSAVMDSDSVLTLSFEGSQFLRFVPDRNGLESYVITTRYGIFPVAVV